MAEREPQLPVIIPAEIDSITVVDWQIVQHNDSTFVTYLISTVLKDSGKKCDVYRRFRDIYALNEWIENTFPTVALPRLPSIFTNPFRSIDSIARDRRPILESYFMKLLQIPEIISTYEVREFLGVHKITSSANSPSESSVEYAPSPPVSLGNSDSNSPDSTGTGTGAVLYVRIDCASNLPEHLFSPTTGAVVEICIPTPIRHKCPPHRIESTHPVGSSKGAASWNEEFAFSVQSQKNVRIMLRGFRNRCVGWTELALTELKRGYVYETTLRFMYGECKNLIDVKIALCLSDNIKIQKPFHCSLPQYRIQLYNPVVYAGQSVKGLAILNIKNAQEFPPESSLVAILYGYAAMRPDANTVVRSSHSSSTDIVATRKKVLLKVNKVLWTANASTSLLPGLYSFPFEFEIPDTVPPSCIFDENASVCFGVKLKLVTLSEHKRVLANSKLLVMSERQPPSVEAGQHQMFHPIGSAVNGILIAGHVAANPVIVGEPAKIFMEIENASIMNITGLSLRVLQELRGEIQPDNIHYSKHREVMVISPVEASFPIPPYASTKINMELIIPPTEPPCFETEPEGTPGIRISLWYQIEAQLDVEGLPARAKIFLLNVVHPRMPQDDAALLKFWPGASLEVVKKHGLYLPMLISSRS